MNVLRKAKYNEILKQLRHPQKRTWIILNPASIGETATVCAFAKAFVEKHGYGITMVVPPEHFPITQMYPGRFEQVFTVDRSVMQDIMRYLPPDQFELDVPFCGFFYNLGDARTDSISYLFKYPGRGGLTYSDIYRHILMLPWSAQLERPRIPAEWHTEARQLAADLLIEPHNSVILFPATTTALRQYPDTLWTSMVTRLKEHGLKVFCNMKGGLYKPETMPIDGAIPIEVPLHLGISLIGIAGRTISPPNGFIHLQMLGGHFDNVTLMCPTNSNFDDFTVNERTYAPSYGLMQMMMPEVCLGASVTEFFVPYDGTGEELRQIGIAVADQDVGHPNCFSRLAPNGRSFGEENADWLGTLIEPKITEDQ